MKKRLLTLIALLILLAAIWIAPAAAKEPVGVIDASETLEFVSGDLSDGFTKSAVSPFSLKTWSSSWTTYKDQLNEQQALIYDGIAANFEGTLPQIVPVTTDTAVYTCWYMDLVALDPIVITGDTIEELNSNINAYLNEELSGQISAAAIAFLWDQPEYFWIRHSFLPSTNIGSTPYYKDGDGYSATIHPQGRVFFLTMPCSDADSEISSLQASIDEVCADIAAAISDMSAYEKLSYFDQWLAENVHYYRAASTSDPLLFHDETPWSIVGALVSQGSNTRRAVCEGYAKAFQLLCHQAEIPCLTIFGTANGGGHMWNAVMLDNVWYFCDTTWNDPVYYSDPYSTKDVSTKKYFLVAMPDSHYPNTEPLLLPPLSDTAYTQPETIFVDSESGKLSGNESYVSQVKVFIALFDENRRMISCGICEEKTVTSENSATVYIYYPPVFDENDWKSAKSIVRFVLNLDHTPSDAAKYLLSCN